MNERPTLSELTALATVYKLRSFRKAADELEISPSTLSHIIRDLETRLGARLFNRTTRSVSPTESGERLVTRVSPLLLELDTALREVNDSKDLPRGVLRLTASDTVAMMLVETVIPHFLQKYPEMSVDLVAEAAFVDIVAEGFDAGFRLGEAVPLDMIAIHVGGPSRMLVVASPAYLHGREIPATPDDLALHNCIRSRTPAGRNYRWEFELAGRPHPVEVQGTLTLNRTEHMLKAALSGMGIAFVPEIMAAPYLSSGQLSSLLEEWCPPYPGIYLYYPGRRLLPPGLKAFIDVLKVSGLSKREPDSAPIRPSGIDQNSK
ncbi:DNA-binding transcriptional LysR family regulator [Rhizobium wenxiniae]|uniref:HTH-type transcriptional regulator TtuA n=1 Tax=Rhizobium wenxiniae TaxID=1737357 RepID=A0A7W9Y815_9HYPH|nr:LysR family transcriptional regulator [Rhizobium wenxiniae]MBB6163696.1 DNA-binding transcriptional LysR family regulator [Rhizobium wenxiniae]